MSVDFSGAEQQTVRLMRLSANLVHVDKMLAAYQDMLRKAWYGDEIDIFTKTIEQMRRNCQQMADGAEQLSRDVLYAAEQMQEQFPDETVTER